MPKSQVVVLGLGRFGETVARNLYQQDHQVLALDMSVERVQEIAPHVTQAAQADIREENTLRDLGVQDFDAVIMAIGGDIPTSLMTTVVLTNMGVKYLVARATDDLHGRTLKRLGADKVVYPERETAQRVAHSLSFPTVVDYLEVSRDYGISKMEAQDSQVGRTLEDLGLAGRRQGDGLSVVLMRRGNNQVICPPDRFEKVLRGDILVLAGRDHEFERLPNDGARR